MPLGPYISRVEMVQKSLNSTVQVAAKTDIGCVRSNNEDFFGYDADRGVFVVCDGVGGQAAGEVASRIAVRTVLDYFGSADEGGEYPTFGRKFDGVSPCANALGSAIQKANRCVWTQPWKIQAMQA